MKCRLAHVTAVPLIAAIQINDAVFYCAEGDEKEMVNDDEFMDEVGHIIRSACSQSQIDNMISILRAVLEGGK